MSKRKRGLTLTRRFGEAIWITPPGGLGVIRIEVNKGTGAQEIRMNILAPETFDIAREECALAMKTWPTASREPQGGANQT